MHEFLCRLDLLVELFDLLVMAVALLVIGIELQALAYLTADQTGGLHDVQKQTKRQEDFKLTHNSPAVFMWSFLKLQLIDDLG